MAMALPAPAEHRAGWTVALGILGATGLGWSALVPLTTAAAPLCRPEAGPLPLLAVWLVMAVTMMLPATLPLIVRRSPIDAIRFGGGYLAIAVLPALVIALAELLLQSAGAMVDGVPRPPVQIALVGIAAFGLVRDARVPRSDHRTGIAAGLSHLGACTAMSALQLAFGSMQPLLMLALSLWMLALVLCPWPLVAREASAQARPTPRSAAVPA